MVWFWKALKTVSRWGFRLKDFEQRELPIHVEPARNDEVQAIINSTR